MKWTLETLPPVAGSQIQTPQAAPGIIPATPPVQQNSGQATPFRAASTLKTNVLVQKTGTPGATAVQVGPFTLEAEGYMQTLMCRTYQVPSSNANANVVAFTEDGKRTAIVNWILKGPGGDITNVAGYDLTVENDYSGLRNDPFGSSTDVSISQAVATSQTTGGSFVQWFEDSMAIGRRSLVGLAGNQDRATKYLVRTDINTSANIWSTAPTTPGVMTEQFYYNERTVPAATDAYGQAQATQPPSYGIVHYKFSGQNATLPAPGKVQHQSALLGNTMRRMFAIFRENSSRSSAEATMNVNNAPTAIQVKLGDTTLYDEDYAYRRKFMWDAYGWDAPNGVLVWDYAEDFGVHAGEELGDDYWNLQNVTNLFLIVTYPSGIGTTSNSLELMVDSLLIPSNLVAQLPALLLG